MSTIDELIRANEDYARQFDMADLPSPPARRVAVVTCMDARLIPSRFLGLKEGDAHIIRNAGGRAKEALRSLVISQQMLGTNEVAVIHHTHCGMAAPDEEIDAKVREQTGADPGDMEWLGFGDLEQSVREDVAFLKESPLIPDHMIVRGFVYDVKTGRVSEVT